MTSVRRLRVFHYFLNRESHPTAQPSSRLAGILGEKRSKKRKQDAARSESWNSVARWVGTRALSPLHAEPYRFNTERRPMPGFLTPPSRNRLLHGALVEVFLKPRRNPHRATLAGQTSTAEGANLTLRLWRRNTSGTFRACRPRKAPPTAHATRSAPGAKEHPSLPG